MGAFRAFRQRRAAPLVNEEEVAVPDFGVIRDRHSADASGMLDDEVIVAVGGAGDQEARFRRQPPQWPAPPSDDDVAMIVP